MPFLNRNTRAGLLPGGPALRPAAADAAYGPGSEPAEHAAGFPPSVSQTPLFPVCANPACRAGRFRVWRHRANPVFEGGWSCSDTCTRALIAAAVARETSGRSERSAAYRHRVPLGLVMLAKGWVTDAQLKLGLEKQRRGDRRRIGEVLIEQQASTPELVTRALALQLNCPLFNLDGFLPARIAPLVPRLLLDTFQALPVRATSSGRLHLAFEDRLDPVLSLAVERMTGLEVTAGILAGPEFRAAHSQMLAAAYPRARIIEAANADALTWALTELIERRKPVASRLVRVDDLFWLRMWTVPPGPASAQAFAPPGIEDVEDVLCTLVRFAEE